MRKQLICLLSLLSLLVSAQPPDKFYTKFGGEGIDIGYGVKETHNRQYALIGSTNSYGAGGMDAYLLLVDSMGQLIWQKTFGGAGTDEGKSILVNPSDSGFVFTGYTNSFGFGGYDVYVVRTDKNGTIIWEKSFGGFDWDFGSDLAFTTDGNIVVCGSSYSSSYGKNDGYLLKINSTNGNLIWQKNYGGLENDEFKSVLLSSDGFLSIAGNSKSFGDLNNDFWLVKTALTGDSILSKSLGIPNKAEMCYDFMEDKLNNLVLCGSYDTSSINSGRNQAYILKTDLMGVFVSQQRYNGAGPDDRILSVTNLTQAPLYCFSRSVLHPPLLNDIQPLLMDYNYNVYTATTYGDYYNDEAYDIIGSKDNGVVLVGYTNGYGASFQDVYLIKLTSGLVNAPLVVGLNEHVSQIKSESTLYFNDNKVFFENPSSENVDYVIINTLGQTVQKGQTNKSYIELEQSLQNDIYYIEVSGAVNSYLKFCK